MTATEKQGIGNRESGTGEQRKQAANRLWQTAEYKCLIDGCVVGKSFEAIGSWLCRSGAACSRMWQRLLDGEVKAPKSHQELLEHAREKFLKSNPSRHDLHRKMDAIRRQTSHNTVMLVYLHAREFASGSTSPGELFDFFSPEIASNIILAAKQIIQYRHAKRSPQNPAAKTSPPSVGPTRTVFTPDGHELGSHEIPTDPDLDAIDTPANYEAAMDEMIGETEMLAGLTL